MKKLPAHHEAPACTNVGSTSFLFLPSPRPNRTFLDIKNLVTPECHCTGSVSAPKQVRWTLSATSSLTSCGSNKQQRQDPDTNDMFDNCERSARIALTGRFAGPPAGSITRSNGGSSSGCIRWNI